MQAQESCIINFSFDEEETQQWYEIFNAVSAEGLFEAGYTREHAEELAEFAHVVWQALYHAGFRVREEHLADEIAREGIINDL